MVPVFLQPLLLRAACTWSWGQRAPGAVTYLEWKEDSRDFVKLVSGRGTSRDCVDLKSEEPVVPCTWSQGPLELEDFPILGGLPGPVDR